MPRIGELDYRRNVFKAVPPAPRMAPAAAKPKKDMAVVRYTGKDRVTVGGLRWQPNNPTHEYHPNKQSRVMLAEDAKKFEGVKDFSVKYDKGE